MLDKKFLKTIDLIWDNPPVRPAPYQSHALSRPSVQHLCEQHIPESAHSITSRAPQYTSAETKEKVLRALAASGLPFAMLLPISVLHVAFVREILDMSQVGRSGNPNPNPNPNPNTNPDPDPDPDPDPNPDPDPDPDPDPNPNPNPNRCRSSSRDASTSARREERRCLSSTYAGSAIVHSCRATSCSSATRREQLPNTTRTA